MISVTRTGIHNGKRFHSDTYSLTSKAISAYRLAKLIRGPRQIENNLHGVKEVIFNEDNCHLQKPNQVATLGIMRNMGFNLLIMAGFDSLTQAMAEIGRN